MKDVLQLSLVDAFQKYAGTRPESIEVDGRGRFKTLCHSHKDSSPSLKIYDKTTKGEGWDFHCFVCGAHGNVVDLVMDMKLAEDKEDAVRLIRKDFGIELPSKVELEFFCRMKGLSVDFCKSNGFTETERGVRIDCLDAKHDISYSKMRVKYEGKDKYYFITGNTDTYDLPFGYHWLSSYKRDQPLYLVEGETDATTLRQAGFQVLGYPSANSFGNVDNSFLTEFTSVIIPRDNDAAGITFVKAIKDIKPVGLHTINFFGAIKDANDFHVFKCGSNIARFTEEFKALPTYPVSYETLVPLVKDNPAMLKDSGVLYNIGLYLENEVEQDMMIDAVASASKISKKTIRSGIEKAFRDTKRKQADDVISTDLTVRDNCYYKIKISDGLPTEVAISNFVVRPSKVLEQDGDTIRVLTLVNNRGRSTQNVFFSAEELTIPLKFAGKCMNSGDFLFKGSSEDLQSISELIFSKELQPVKAPSMVGRMDDGRWIFKNFGIERTGEIVETNEEGIIDFGDTRYLPKSLFADSEGDSNLDIPDLPNQMPEVSEDAVRRFLHELRTSFGTEGVYTGLGWLIAGINSHLVFEKYRMFPYLMSIGKRASGKSTYAGIIYELLGFGQHKISSIDSPTQVGMLRTLKYMSNLPVVYDDYRNTNKIKYKDNLLLDIYNRHGGNKGTLQANVVRQEKIRGFVMLSGEDVPSNNALRTRCVELHISANQGERSLEKLHTLQGMVPHMQRHMLSMIQKYQSTEAQTELMHTIHTLSTRLETEVSDQRYATNAAIFAGAFIHAFGHILSEGEIDRYLEYVINTSRQDKQDSDEEHGEILFFKDVVDMVSKGLLDKSLVCIKDGEMLIRMRPVHKEWSRYLKATGTDGDVLGEYTLRKYFSKENFYTDERRIRITSGQYRFSTIDLTLFAEQFPLIADDLRATLVDDDKYDDVEF